MVTMPDGWLIADVAIICTLSGFIACVAVWAWLDRRGRRRMGRGYFGGRR